VFLLPRYLKAAFIDFMEQNDCSNGISLFSVYVIYEQDPALYL
jgi:hypothetical protein